MENFTNLFSNIKNRISKEKNFYLFEGILLVLLGTISLFFDNNLTAKFLLLIFPLIIAIIGFKNIILGYKNYKLNNKKYIIIIIEGLIFILFAIYFTLHPLKVATTFIFWVGIFIIAKNLLDLINTPNKLASEIVTYLLKTLVGLLFIAYPEVVINTMYNFILIIMIIYGFIKIILATFLDRLLKNLK